MAIVRKSRKTKTLEGESVGESQSEPASEEEKLHSSDESQVSGVNTSTENSSKKHFHANGNAPASERFSSESSTDEADQTEGKTVVVRTRSRRTASEGNQRYSEPGSDEHRRKVPEGNLGSDEPRRKVPYRETRSSYDTVVSAPAAGNGGESRPALSKWSSESAGILIIERSLPPTWTAISHSAAMVLDSS